MFAWNGYCEQTADPRVKGTALRAAGLRPGPDGLPIDPRASACFERVRVLSQDRAERGFAQFSLRTKRASTAPRERVMTLPPHRWLTEHSLRRRAATRHSRSA